MAPQPPLGPTPALSTLPEPHPLHQTTNTRRGRWHKLTPAAMFLLGILVLAVVPVRFLSTRGPRQDSEIKVPKQGTGKVPRDPEGPLPKPGEEKEWEFTQGVKMTFCWIPPGTAQLGSPRAEREEAEKQEVTELLSYPDA